MVFSVGCSWDYAGEIMTWLGFVVDSVTGGSKNCFSLPVLRGTMRGKIMNWFLSDGSINMAGTFRGPGLPGLLPARKNLGRRRTNASFSVGKKQLLQVGMEGQILQAPSNSPRGRACSVVFFFWAGQRTPPGWHSLVVALQAAAAVARRRLGRPLGFSGVWPVHSVTAGTSGMSTAA